MPRRSAWTAYCARSPTTALNGIRVLADNEHHGLPPSARACSTDQNTIGTPPTGWSTLFNCDFRRVPWPAASIATSEALAHVTPPEPSLPLHIVSRRSRILAPAASRCPTRPAPRIALGAQKGDRQSQSPMRVDPRDVAGAEGFEPPNSGSKGRCLTAWRRPITERF